MAALSATIAALGDRAERARTRNRVQLAEPRRNRLLQRATAGATAKQQEDVSDREQVHQWWTDNDLRMLLLGGWCCVVTNELRWLVREMTAPCMLWHFRADISAHTVSSLIGSNQNACLGSACSSGQLVASISRDEND